jgi:hypothetical protein
MLTQQAIKTRTKLRCNFILNVIGHGARWGHRAGWLCTEEVSCDKARQVTASYKCLQMNKLWSSLQQIHPRSFITTSISLSQNVHFKHANPCTHKYISPLLSWEKCYNDLSSALNLEDVRPHYIRIPHISVRALRISVRVLHISVRALYISVRALHISVRYLHISVRTSYPLRVFHFVLFDCIYMHSSITIFHLLYSWNTPSGLSSVLFWRTRLTATTPADDRVPDNFLVNTTHA